MHTHTSVTVTKITRQAPRLFVYDSTLLTRSFTQVFTLLQALYTKLCLDLVSSVYFCANSTISMMASYGLNLLEFHIWVWWYHILSQVTTDNYKLGVSTAILEPD